MFFRLLGTDADDGGDPETADFDDDGLTAMQEITNQPQPNPLDEDTDADGINDLAEYLIIHYSATDEYDSTDDFSGEDDLDNNDENTIHYWYNGTIKSAANSATNSGHVYFTKNGHGIPAANFANILNSSQYYKLEDGNITTVSIPALSDEALEAHTTSLFKIYKQEALENYSNFRLPIKL